MSDLLPRAMTAARQAMGIGDTPDLVVRCRVVSAEAVARAVVAEVLAALREPSEPMLAAISDRKPWIGHPEARPESVGRYRDSVKKAAASDMATMLDAFAREHGLETPAS